MPRKNARPAARKIQAKLTAKLAAVGRFQKAAQPILATPRHGDGVILAALASRLLGKGGH